MTPETADSLIKKIFVALAKNNLAIKGKWDSGGPRLGLGTVSFCELNLVFPKPLSSAELRAVALFLGKLIQKTSDEDQTQVLCDLGPKRSFLRLGDMAMFTEEDFTD